MKLSPIVDLGRSLRQVFGDKADFLRQIEQDRDRQTETANAILRRFFGSEAERRELVILADEVGLGKTYVALAVAVSILDAIRRGEIPDGLPTNKPVVLVLTPTSDALFNKWLREAEGFKKSCARNDGDLDWLEIRSPMDNTNVIDLSIQITAATRSKPMLLLAKQRVLGGALHERDLWRQRGLAATFKFFRTPYERRRYWCRKGKVFENSGIPDLDKLLDLRGSAELWQGLASESSFDGALRRHSTFAEKLRSALDDSDEDMLSRRLDDLVRLALVGGWPQLPLVIFDEIHGLKNPVQPRRDFEFFLTGGVCRILGLSATPFQLRHDELLSLLNMRKALSVPSKRHYELSEAVRSLETSMGAARDSGEVFRKRWKALQSDDKETIEAAWHSIMKATKEERRPLAEEFRPPRIGHAITAALDLETKNAALRRHLRPFVIRHQHPRGYREHFVGGRVEATGRHGTASFSWAPGMEVTGNDELAHYLMMRAVALAKDERGLPGLGAELTGSFRHLVETSAVWKKLESAKSPLLRDYRLILEEMIGRRTNQHDPDAAHRKIQSTVNRALEFFKRGQKTLIFCVYTKTAEAVRDQLRTAVDAHLRVVRDKVFANADGFDNFRRRFFNRREPLFALIQDHPLLGLVEGGRIGVEQQIRLGLEHLRQVGEQLLNQEEYPDTDKPDRRLLIAATEQVAVNYWSNSPEGERWLKHVLRSCPGLADKIVHSKWLEAREPLSRSARAGRATKARDPEASAHATDPLDMEEAEQDLDPRRQRNKTARAIDMWMDRIRKDTLGATIAPYFQDGLISVSEWQPPLLAQHHWGLLAQLDLETRAVAGQVFRRILMAEEFFLRYLTDVEKEQTRRWSDVLAERYVKPLDGHLESLRDRVHAYLETLVRAKDNQALLAGYHAGAENRNVVQLVTGGTENRDRYFLGFNTPYRPEILVSTSVGQEGIDLHRECRHVIQHDLCWNPAMIEQRTGRVDRIGSKVERERMGIRNVDGPSLEIAVPYLAATYDERMFEELYRRAQLFEVTLGGDIRVDTSTDVGQSDAQLRRRKELGIGSENEDLGEESDESAVVDIPLSMVERLRVDLSEWNLPNMQQ
jgi:hypothetical protein